MFIISDKYAYFLGTLIFFIPWLILYLTRKDLRKEMLFMSIGIAVGSFVTAYFWWTVDWWLPETITGTRVGIEDLLLGFSNGGIAAALYEGIFKKRFYKRGRRDNSLMASFVCLLLIFVISFLFWGLNVTSFYASSIAMAIAGILMLVVRKDFFINALASAFLMVLVSIPIYLIGMELFPGFIEKTWMFEKLTGFRPLGIPLEDLIFYFLFGFIIGPFYEFWQGYRLKNKK